MVTETETTLTTVVSDVLEHQAFMFVDECPKTELEQDAGASLHVTMGFEGPVSGSIGMAVPRTMCVELAANILGVEPDDDFAVEGAPDAFQELLNVVCGQLLTSLYGSEPVFHLSIPRVEEIGEEAWEALVGQEDAVGYMFDEWPAIAHFALEVDEQ